MVIDICIDLSYSGNDSRIAYTNLVQKESFDKLIGRIGEELTAARRSHRDRMHGTGGGMAFFIDGTRGAGKSTFLRSTVQALTNPTAIPELKDWKLLLLAEIDPTKIATGEHILLTILQKLKVLTPASKFSSDDEERYQERIRSGFKKVSQGLSILRPGHNVFEHIDPEALLDIGLERAQGGFELAGDIARLVDEVCRYRGVDALVIAIDDADTNFSKGKELLETIRCYLDCPRLVILMTGDMEMYTHLVRQKFRNDMGSVPQSQGSTVTVRGEALLDHLQDQYLIKLLPIRNRVHLLPLAELVKSNKYDITVAYEYAHIQLRTKIIECLKDFVRKGFSLKSESDIAQYVQFILNQPLRSVIQLMQICAHQQEVTPEVMAECMRAMLLGSLYGNGIDIDALSAGDYSALQSAFFDVVLRNGDYDTGCYLRPQPIDSALRNCFVALATEVARHVFKRPDVAISFILQGPGSSSIFNLAKAEIPGASDEERARAFKDYMGVGHAEDALNWAWHMPPLLSTAGHRVVRTGVIGLALTSKGTDQLTIKKVIGKSKPAERPAFALSINHTVATSESAYASIFNILGLMARLLTQGREIIASHINHAETALPDVRKELLELVIDQLERIDGGLTISIPSWKQGGSQKTSDEDEDDVGQDNGPGSSENLLKKWGSNPLANATVEWLLSASRLAAHVKPSAVMLGKVWTRLYFSLDRCANELRPTENGVGSIMMQYAWCVINAFLVEERYHHIECTSKQNIWRKNPIKIGSQKQVISEIESAGGLDEFPLTKIIFTCPIMMGLLDASDVEGLLEETELSNLAGVHLDPQSWVELDDLRITRGSNPKKAKAN